MFGDVLKQVFFWAPGANVGSGFKACAAFQMGMDVLLGVQFWMYGSGEVGGSAGVGGALEMGGLDGKF